MIPQATHENQFYLVTMLYKCSNTYFSKFWPAFLIPANVDKFLNSDTKIIKR